MENDLTKQIEDRLAQLPDDVRAAVLSSEWEEKVQGIGAKNQLHVDQVGTLGDITLMAMLGFLSLAEYPAKIERDLGTSGETASKIAQAVNDEVFLHIRESLKTVPAPKTIPAPAATGPATMAVPPALIKPELHAANEILATKSVTLPPSAPPSAAMPPAPAPTAPPQPQPYSKDPYREPPVP